MQRVLNMKLNAKRRARHKGLESAQMGSTNQEDEQLVIALHYVQVPNT